jgi:hypothetical protein
MAAENTERHKGEQTHEHKEEFHARVLSIPERTTTTGDAFISCGVIVPTGESDVKTRGRAGRTPARPLGRGELGITPRNQYKLINIKRRTR